MHDIIVHDMIYLWVRSIHLKKKKKEFDKSNITEELAIFVQYNHTQTPSTYNNFMGGFI